MSTIQCNIVSPEGELFSGPVELLSAEGGAGEIAITPRHAPLLTNLKPGPVKLVLEGGEEEIFFASGRFSRSTTWGGNTTNGCSRTSR